MQQTTTTIVGNLTRDPELRYTPDGAPVATFGIAVNKRKQNDAGEWEDNGAAFFNVTCWRDLATNVAASLEKGARAIVYGHLDLNQWQTEDGAKRQAVEVVADAIGPDLRWATAKVAKAERRHADQPPHPADAHTSNDAHASNEEPF